MEENTVELVIECLARNKYVPSLQAEGCRFLEVCVVVVVAREERLLSASPVTLRHDIRRESESDAWVTCVPNSGRCEQTRARRTGLRS